jgi:hypothetical protein
MTGSGPVARLNGTSLFLLDYFSLVAPFSRKFLTFSVIPGHIPAAGASFGWPARLQAEWFKTVGPFGSVHIFLQARAPT